MAPPECQPADRKNSVLERARALILAGQAGEAVELLEGVRDASPEERPRLHVLLGDAYRVQDRFESARAAYDQALAGWPGAPPEGLLMDLATVLGDQLHHPEDAARIWTRYLEGYPRGQFAGRALAHLASLADSRGEEESAEAFTRRMIEVASDAPETLAAVVRVGRKKLARHNLDGAAEWFLSVRASTAPGLSEAGVVGLMRARVEQGRYADVRTLAAEYRRRFPGGLRQSEVKQALESVPSSERE
jgi:tetratricopeptide (TPR) repeat protein